MRPPSIRFRDFWIAGGNVSRAVRRHKETVSDPGGTRVRADENVHPVVILPQTANLHLMQTGGDGPAFVSRGCRWRHPAPDNLFSRRPRAAVLAVSLPWLCSGSSLRKSAREETIYSARSMSGLIGGKIRKRSGIGMLSNRGILYQRWLKDQSEWRIPIETIRNRGPRLFATIRFWLSYTTMPSQTAASISPCDYTVLREAVADQVETLLLEMRTHLHDWLPVLVQEEAKTTAGAASERRMVVV